MARRKHRVLMFGWEFPPYSSGGLGTACYGLTKGLKNHDVDVVFVVPKGDSSAQFASHLKELKIASDVMAEEYNKEYNIQLAKLRIIDSPLRPYMTPSVYARQPDKKDIYGGDLYEEVERFAHIAKRIALEEEFDVIHCHDWITFKAGINAKKVSNKPLVVHVHATEFDRSGGNINRHVYSIERQGVHAADRVLCVSNLTRNMVIKHYGVQADKVSVVHNGIEHPAKSYSDSEIKKLGLKKNCKIVLFLGRITMQKGPDYFVEAAKRVLGKMSNVRFIVVGTGDMEAQVIERSAELGIGSKVLFTGFMNSKEVDKAFRMADVYVMPSVSEPFGLTALESMRNGTPCIISKQSGVSEVIKHCLKVDFWDVDELANKIICVLNYPRLKNTLAENGLAEVKKIDWNAPAKKCVDVYRQLKEIQEIHNNYDNSGRAHQGHAQHIGYSSAKSEGW